MQPVILVDVGGRQTDRQTDRQIDGRLVKVCVPGSDAWLACPGFDLSVWLRVSPELSALFSVSLHCIINK